MTVIVNSGSILILTPASGLTLTADSTIAAGGELAGAGMITGAFDLLNLGLLDANGGGTLIINSGTFDNQGIVRSAFGDLLIAASVAIPNLSNGTLSAGTWQNEGTIRIDTGLITTDDTTITLQSNPVFNDFDSGTNTEEPIANSMSVVGTHGDLELLETNWNAPGSFTDAGTVDLQNGTISAVGGITVSAGGTLGGTTGSEVVASPLQVDGLVFSANGNLTLQSTVSGSGTLLVEPAAFLTLESFQTYTQTVINQGGIDVAGPSPGGTVAFAGSISGPGGFTITGGASAAAVNALELPGSIGTNQVNFGTGFGKLILDSPTTYTGIIFEFDNSDTIVLANISANAAILNGTTGPFGESSGTLAINNGASTVDTLTLQAPSVGPHLTAGWDYSNAVFNASGNDGNTTITVSGVVVPSVICFRVGTRIATPDGDVPIQQLAVGDSVKTHLTGEAPIVWIGHRTIDCRSHPDPSLVLPIRVAAHAFGWGRPRQDLYLSPNHAVFADRVLIPIRLLINHATIEQVMVDTVTYFHVELAEHDILLAEGLAAESYLDTGDRALFINGGPRANQFPDRTVRTWEMRSCAPLITTGNKVDKVRAKLKQRAWLVGNAFQPDRPQHARQAMERHGQQY